LKLLVLKVYESDRVSNVKGVGLAHIEFDLIDSFQVVGE